MLILTYLLLWGSLVALLWAGTLFVQDFLYSEPAPQLYWRAPAAAAAVTLWVAFWGYLDSRNPGRYPALFDFSAAETTKFNELWVVKDNKKVHYKLTSGGKGNLPGRVEFREVDPPHRVWSRSDAVIVKENGEEVRFEAEKDKNNHYKIDEGQELRYRDDRGRVMTEGSMGRIYSRRWGVFFTYVLLNLGFLGVWFAAVWLLLRYYWSHALGIAVVLWAAMTLIILPLMLARVEDVARAAG